ncbi:MAG: hydroxyacylglutathione hydrolase [Burkholderiales bacterium]|nr:hydroxyacylglutathione hydrolase [Burkholderiales bacterium]
MKLIPLPAFSDNYIWMLHDGQRCVVVDPGAAAPVLDALQANHLQLQAIVVTHHHADHTGGVDILREATGAQVYGPATEALPEPAQRVTDGQHLNLLGLDFVVLSVPGHTAGHVAYYCADVDGSPLLFCGDTLFSAGCGRVFEGTPAQMLNSLQRLAQLPDATRVCCAHEYTLSNLRFALAVEPDNAALIDYHAHCQQRRSAGEPTLPARMDQERRINPFLRSTEPAVAAAVRQHDPVAAQRDGVFATLREWKNQFR